MSLIKITTFLCYEHREIWRNKRSIFWAHQLQGTDNLWLCVVRGGHASFLWQNDNLGRKISEMGSDSSAWIMHWSDSPLWQDDNSFCSFLYYTVKWYVCLSALYHLSTWPSTLFISFWFVIKCRLNRWVCSIETLEDPTSFIGCKGHRGHIQW